MAIQYEIEVKSLLGSKENTNTLLKKLANTDEKFHQFDNQSQLNHYFIGGSMANLATALKQYIAKDKLNVLKEIEEKATSCSVRSREKNGKTFLVIKGSLDKTSAAHSHRRIEFEEPIGLGIIELDKLLIDTGFEYEAKWSAERKMYKYKDLTLDFFFTPGYGYLVEFEKVIYDNSKIEQTRSYILQTMDALGVEELDPARLERMFTYYNAHWPDYYGTKNVFTIE